MHMRSTGSGGAAVVRASAPRQAHAAARVQARAAQTHSSSAHGGLSEEDMLFRYAAGRASECGGACGTRRRRCATATLRNIHGSGAWRSASRSLFFSLAAVSRALLRHAARRGLGGAGELPERSAVGARAQRAAVRQRRMVAHPRARRAAAAGAHAWRAGARGVRQRGTARVACMACTSADAAPAVDGSGTRRFRRCRAASRTTTGARRTCCGARARCPSFSRRVPCHASRSTAQQARARRVRKP